MKIMILFECEMTFYAPSFGMITIDGIDLHYYKYSLDNHTFQILDYKPINFKICNLIK
jgi:hypothetical protein